MSRKKWSPSVEKKVHVKKEVITAWREQIDDWWVLTMIDGWWLMIDDWWLMIDIIWNVKYRLPQGGPPWGKQYGAHFIPYLYLFCHQSPIISHHSSIISHQSSIINHQLSIIIRRSFEGHSGIIRGSFGHYLRVIRESFEGHSAIIWESFGDHFRVIQGSFERLSGIIRGPFGIIWGSFGDHLSVIRGSFEMIFGWFLLFLGAFQSGGSSKRASNRANRTNRGKAPTGHGWINRARLLAGNQ